jgi:iron complex transport system substrate-binding protein
MPFATPRLRLSSCRRRIPLSRTPGSRGAGLIAALALLLLAAPTGAAPRTVTDAAGRTITVDAPVQRLVVMFNYEEFTAIAGREGWDKVVGYSKTPWAGWRTSIWERYVQAIPRIGIMPDVGHNDDGSFSAEKVIALRPQVVIMPQWAFATQSTAVAQFAALGIPTLVIDYNAQEPAKHVASTLAIGAVMGAEPRAKELAELYQREIDDIRRRIAAAAVPRKPKVYVEIGSPGPHQIGNTYTTTMWGRILDLLGADNIATGKIASAYGLMNAEAVIAANPEFIFIAGSSWPNVPQSVRLGYEVDAAATRATLAPYVARPGWPGLAAVKSGQVFAIQHGLARTLFDFTAMQFIAKQLYPAQFADVDPEASLRRYHERYLPIAYGGVWMLRLAP